MMRLVLLIGAFTLWMSMGGGGAVAQPTADSYFHEAAQQYVAGNDAAARRAVTQGLRKAPSDPRLVALRKKLQNERRSEEKSEDASTQNKPSQQNSTQSGNNTSEGEDNPSSSEDQDKSQSGAQDRSEQESQAERGAGDGGQSGRQTGQQTGQTDPSESFSPTESTPEQGARQGDGVPRDTLSRAQAERLLQALEGQERQLLRQLQTRSATSETVEKDW